MHAYSSAYKTNKAIVKGKKEKPAKAARQKGYNPETGTPMICWLTVPA